MHFTHCWLLAGLFGLGRDWRLEWQLSSGVVSRRSSVAGLLLRCCGAVTATLRSCDVGTSTMPATARCSHVSSCNKANVASWLLQQQVAGRVTVSGLVTLVKVCRLATRAKYNSADRTHNEMCRVKTVPTGGRRTGSTSAESTNQGNDNRGDAMYSAMLQKLCAANSWIIFSFLCGH